MRDPFRWSISLGRWGIPTVRVHVFFFVFAAATYFLCWQDASSVAGSLTGTATMAMLLLLLSVLAHEWGHWVVARRFGLAPDTLVVGPLGGASPWPRGAAEMRGRGISMLAGPLANLLMCAVCIAMVRAAMPEVELLRLLNPLAPVWAEPFATPVRQVLLLTIWINWLLFLINLLPAFPFDGGLLLQALLRSVRPGWSDRRVAGTVFWIAVGLAAVIMAVALVFFKYEDATVFPTSYALLLLSVVLLFAARQDIADTIVDERIAAPEGKVGHEAGQRAGSRGCREQGGAEAEARDLAGDGAGDGANEEEGAGEVAEGQQREAERGDQPAFMDELSAGYEDSEDAAEEERLVDVILSRLHSEGLESLTPEDRELLERASARYRSRLGRRS